MPKQRMGVETIAASGVSSQSPRRREAARKILVRAATGNLAKTVMRSTACTTEAGLGGAGGGTLPKQDDLALRPEAARKILVRAATGNLAKTVLRFHHVEVDSHC